MNFLYIMFFMLRLIMGYLEVILDKLLLLLEHKKPAHNSKQNGLLVGKQKIEILTLLWFRLIKYYRINVSIDIVQEIMMLLRRIWRAWNTEIPFHIILFAAVNKIMLPITQQFNLFFVFNLFIIQPNQPSKLPTFLDPNWWTKLVGIVLFQCLLFNRYFHLFNLVIILYSWILY